MKHWIVRLTFIFAAVNVCGLAHGQTTSADVFSDEESRIDRQFATVDHFVQPWTEDHPAPFESYFHASTGQAYSEFFARRNSLRTARSELQNVQSQVSGLGALVSHAERDSATLQQLPPLADDPAAVAAIKFRTMVEKAATRPEEAAEFLELNKNSLPAWNASDSLTFALQPDAKSGFFLHVTDAGTLFTITRSPTLPRRTTFEPGTLFLTRREIDFLRTGFVNQKLVELRTALTAAEQELPRATEKFEKSLGAFKKYAALFLEEPAASKFSRLVELVKILDSGRESAGTDRPKPAGYEFVSEPTATEKLPVLNLLLRLTRQTEPESALFPPDLVDRYLSWFKREAGTDGRELIRDWLTLNDQVHTTVMAGRRASALTSERELISGIQSADIPELKAVVDILLQSRLHKELASIDLPVHLNEGFRLARSLSDIERSGLTGIDPLADSNLRIGPGSGNDFDVVHVDSSEVSRHKFWLPRTFAWVLRLPTLERELATAQTNLESATQLFRATQAKFEKELSRIRSAGLSEFTEDLALTLKGVATKTSAKEIFDEHHSAHHGGSVAGLCKFWLHLVPTN